MTTPLTPATARPGDRAPSADAGAGHAVARPRPSRPPSTVAVATRRRSAGWLNLLLGAAAILAVGGVAFAVGRSTAPAAAFGGRPGAGGP